MLRTYAQFVAGALVAYSLTVTSAGFSAAHGATESARTATLDRDAAAKKGVLIRVWDPFLRRSHERTVLRGVVQNWERLTGNRVSLGGYTGSNNLKMCGSAPEGQGPDLVAVPHLYLSQLIACQAIQPVPARVWPAAQQGRYVEAAIEATRIDGQQWGMPWAVQTYGIYYNKALIPPSFFDHRSMQWSQVIDKAKTLTDLKAHKYGLVWDSTSYYLDYGIISARGGYAFRYTGKGFDRNSLGVESPGTIAGIQFVRDLTTAGTYKLIPGTLTGLAAVKLFEQGKAAMYLTGPWDEEILRENKIHSGFVPLPAAGTGISHPFAQVEVFAVNKRSRHASEALELLQYMTVHMQLPEYGASAPVPVIKSYLASRNVQKSALAGGLARAVLSAEAVPNIPEMDQVWQPMNLALSRVVTGRASPRDAAHDAAVTIRKNIAKMGG